MINEVCCYQTGSFTVISFIVFEFVDSDYHALSYDDWGATHSTGGICFIEEKFLIEKSAERMNCFMSS